MLPDLFSQLSIDYHVSFQNMPTYVCQSRFISVCIFYFEVRVKVILRVTDFNKVICYVIISFLKFITEVTFSVYQSLKRALVSV